jgi:hypothetical protein
VLNKFSHAYRQLVSKQVQKNHSFGKQQLKHLGHWVNSKGTMPLPKKINALCMTEPPKTKCELRWFIGVVNFCRDM